jgi:galactokinase
LGGNHTDHNLGKVLCAAVQKDTLAAAAPRNDGLVVIRSEGFDETFHVDSGDLDLRREEKGTTNALIRGVLAGIRDSGGKVGGFDATVTSDVEVGSGLSSSASFEVLICSILNTLYNDESLWPEKMARISQIAENAYFGKPCGLMDQTASAVGGIIKIDFEDPLDLKITKIGFDLEHTDYRLIVVNSGSNHVDLTPAYASIPAEMRMVARELGVRELREASERELRLKMLAIRTKLGDRAVLRATHFYAENHRVDLMETALENDDFATFLAAVEASGASSQNILQNAIPPQSDGTQQGLGFALGLSQLFFEKAGRGIARVHGGGFAGTIQAYIHKDDFAEYESTMTSIFGSHSVSELVFRQSGAGHLLEL